MVPANLSGDDLVAHFVKKAIALDAMEIEVEYESGREHVIAVGEYIGVDIGSIQASGKQARALRETLWQISEQPRNMIIGGSEYVLTVQVHESFGEDVYRVTIKRPHPAPQADAREAPRTGHSSKPRADGGERWAGKRKKIRDYTEQLSEFWPTIMQAWEAHADKRPVIECDVTNNKVRAYPSRSYIDSLSERTREAAHREFARTMDEGGIMVFVMDSRNRVLQSYSFPRVKTVAKSKPDKVSPRIAHPRRVRKR